MSTEKIIHNLLKKPVTYFEKFYQKTKLHTGILEIPITEWPKEWKTIYYKIYYRLDKINLPHKKKVNNETNSLSKLLLSRKSRKSFSKKKLSLDELGTLLFLSAGSTMSTSSDQDNRFYPSAGKRYPLEVYVISLNLEIPRGVYHYNVREHLLEVLKEDIPVELKNLLVEENVKSAGAVIVITAVFYRTTMKYGERGNRYVLLEAGHLGQNMYLVAEALRLAVCGIGGYYDDMLARLLNIQQVDESVVHVLVLGKKKSDPK